MDTCAVWDICVLTIMGIVVYGKYAINMYLLFYLQAYNAFICYYVFCMTINKLTYFLQQ